MELETRTIIIKNQRIQVNKQLIKRITKNKYNTIKRININFKIFNKLY